MQRSDNQKCEREWTKESYRHRCNHFIVHGSGLTRHLLYHQLVRSKEHPRLASTSRKSWPGWLSVPYSYGLSWSTDWALWARSKGFCQSKGCLRVPAYQSLDSTIQPLTTPFHDCCSHCAVSCKCNGDSCSALVPEHEKRVVDEHENVVKDRKQKEVTEEEREELKVALREVLKDIPGVGLHLDEIAGWYWMDSQDNS